MLLKYVGEYNIHHWLKEHLERHPNDVVGIGDDCSVLDIMNDKFLLLTSDRVAPSAFLRSFEYVGKLCVLQNLSDVIAMGGEPLGLLIDTYVPEEFKYEDWRSIMEGAQDQAIEYGAFILGGDTKQSKEPVVIGFAIGVVEKKYLLRRDTAEIGDVLAITLKGKRKIGPPWAYYLTGRYNLNVSEKFHSWLRNKYFDDNLKLPYKETRAATLTGAVSACVDTSDGIGGAIKIIKSKKTFGINIKYNKVLEIIEPKIRKIADIMKVDLIKFAFSPGFVWENVFTIKNNMFNLVKKEVQNAGGELVQIGEIVENPGIRMILENNKIKNINLIHNENFKGGEWLKRLSEHWINTPLFQ